ncbi:MFS transporter [Pararoseomonas indoligenes]|uniref:MFS transporter n=1 Tax=Roseomonas indoligenes TaxID=2820811 RepID=UPI001FD82768|nr:MFS transporter [Pararoseomonas indoligenes]
MAPNPSDIPRPPHGTGAAELALALGALALGISEFAAMGLLPRIAGETGVSVPHAGLAISAYAVGVVVGAPVIALLLARLPRRPLLSGLAVLIALGNLASAAAPDFLGVCAARFLAGLPHGAYLGTAAMVAASLVPPERRASAVARVILGLSVANVVGVPLATWVGQLVSWRVVFALVAVVALGCALMIRLCLPVIGAGPALGARREVGAMLRPQVLLALATTAIGFGGMFAIYSYIAPTLTEVTRVGESTVPVMLAVFGAGMILGNLLGGWLADRGVMRAIGIMLAVGLVAQFLFLFTPVSLPLVTLNIVLIAATSMGLGPALQTRLLDVAPDAQMLAASLSHSAFNMANALGAWLGGAAVAAGLGWTATGGVGAVLTLAGLAVFAVAWALERGRAAVPA